MDEFAPNVEKFYKHMDHSKNSFLSDCRHFMGTDLVSYHIADAAWDIATGDPRDHEHFHGKLAGENSSYVRLHHARENALVLAKMINGFRVQLELGKEIRFRDITCAEYTLSHNRPVCVENVSRKSQREKELRSFLLFGVGMFLGLLARLLFKAML